MFQISDSFFANSLPRRENRYPGGIGGHLLGADASLRGGPVSYTHLEDLIEEEECVFTLTAGGYIKRTAASTYKAQRRGGKGITAMSTKEEDYVDTVFTASTHDFILFFTNKGRVHRKKGYQIPEAGRTARGTNLVNVLPIEQDEKVTAMIHLREFPEDRYLVMVTRSGTVKRIQLSSIYTARKAGIRCITLDEGDELICVRETDGDQAILCLLYTSRCV